MRKSFGRELREGAAQSVVDGRETVVEVGARLDASVPLVRQWVYQWRKKHEPNDKRRPRGRPPVLEGRDIEVLARLAQERPNATNAELIAALAAEVNKRTSARTLVKALQSVGITRKRPPKGSVAASPCGDQRGPSGSSPAPAPVPEPMSSASTTTQLTRYKDEHRREPAKGKYPSSLTDAEWEVLKTFVESEVAHRGRPCKYSRRAILDAVFYIVRSGCAWRMLPLDLPPWRAVWSTFRRWRKSGMILRIYDELHALWRRNSGRNELPSAGIVDSQSVKTTEKGGLLATTPARRSKGASATSSLTPSA
jgi:putative transposase